MRWGIVVGALAMASGCSSSTCDDTSKCRTLEDASTPPAAFEALDPWPAAAAPRKLPAADLRYWPALVKGYPNKRTPSPETLAAGTARRVTDGLFAALGHSLANRQNDPAKVDFNLVPIVQISQASRPAPSTIIVSISGLYAGGGSFLSLGGELVRAAAAQGKAIEVWTIDRRSNLFEDREGIVQADASGHPADALTYYGLAGAEPKGFVEPPHKEFLFQAEWGLDTHLRDYRAVVMEAKKRAPKVVLLGHSLGAMQIGAYLGYDFAAKGAPEELGANDVDGAVFLDGVLSPNSGAADSGLQSFVSGGVSGDFGFPIPGLRDLRTPRDGDTLAGTFLSVKGLIDPPLLQRLATLGVGVLHTPDVVTSITIPAPFVVASNGPRTMTGPYAAVFPATLDDDFSSVDGLRFSLGFPDDAPASLGAHQSDRANPNGLWALADTSEQKPLKWLDFKQVAAKAKDPAVPQYGTAEVQDFRTTAEVVAGGPTMDFLEWYYPLRLLLDLQLIADLDLDTTRVSDGDASNDFEAETEMTRFGEPPLRLVGLARVDTPVLALRGENGILQGGAGAADHVAGEKTFAAFAKRLAPAKGGLARVNADGSFGPGFEVHTVAGYTHNDVLLAEPNACVPLILGFLK